MSELKISVVMPSYNQASFIEEAIDSIINQSYKNFELIILDSMSNDGTIDKLRKYESHKNIKIIIEKDKGQADALFKGFGICSGDIYCWLNSDDVFAENVFFRVANIFMNNPEIDILNGELDVIDEKSDWVSVWPRRKIKNIQWLHYPQTIGQPSTFFSSRIYRKVGGINPIYNYAMDYDLFFRFILAGAKMEYANDKYAKFRVHGHSKTMSLPYKFWREEIKVFYTLSNKKIISGFYYWKFRGILSTIFKQKVLKSRKY